MSPDISAQNDLCTSIEMPIKRGETKQDDQTRFVSGKPSNISLKRNNLTSRTVSTTKSKILIQGIIPLPFQHLTGIRQATCKTYA